MKIYHFTDSRIEQFEFTKPRRGYSQATGYGIYFTTDFEKGNIKYGSRSKYIYICEFDDNSRILDLGQHDAMYFNGKKIHSSSLVSENFKRKINGLELIPEPEIVIESLTKEAYDWLIKNGYTAVKGMDYWGYACPEFVVLKPELIKILDYVSLNGQKGGRRLMNVSKDEIIRFFEEAGYYNVEVVGDRLLFTSGDEVFNWGINEAISYIEGVCGRKERKENSIER